MPSATAFLSGNVPAEPNSFIGRERDLAELARLLGAAAIGGREEPGVPLAQTLAEALRSRHMLLILDTCEHQVGDCATLVQLLLARCPWLRIIATSREPLRVRGETVWRGPPLDLPPDGVTGLEAAAPEAVRLV